MNQTRQQILVQCRERGGCVLATGQFESAFLSGCNTPGLRLTEFCIENRVDLVVEGLSGHLAFRAKPPDGSPDFAPSPSHRSVEGAHGLI